ncbi:MAG: copper homeostasis protein CutC [Saprospiraceae bacterium]|nr:copper homeostasis protein CutC [Saprospiraceae bacterium]
MPPTRPLLEIAVHSFQSAQAALTGGADRMELCSALQTGGLTPGLGLLDLILESSTIPVHVLVRPRLGNFIYDGQEFATVLRSVEVCRKNGASGIVVGFLDKNYRIERSQLSELIAVAGPLDLTFHRAIDVCSDVFGALDMLMDAGFHRVLSSGRATTALAGIPMLQKMVAHTADSKLSIMAGAGVTAANVLKILNSTGCDEIHASAKKAQTLQDNDTLDITSVYGSKVTTKWESDIARIKVLKAKVISFAS